MSRDPHPFDELNDLVSGRLSEAERRRVEQHVATCERCQSERDRAIAVRELMRRTEDDQPLPADLQTRVASALDRQSLRRRRRLAWSMAAAAVALLIVLVVWRTTRTDFPAAAIADYHGVSTGELQFQMRTADTTGLERWFDQQLEFRTRVFDFAMMRYTLLGGRIDSLGRRRSALFAYRGERGDLIVCEMSAARTDELPPGAEKREHNGIEFHIYERNGIKAVFWQEGAVVCVLTGAGPREEVILLAYAKAMKV